MSSGFRPCASATSRLILTATLLWATPIVAHAQRTTPSAGPTPAKRPAGTRRAAPVSLGIFQGTTDVGRPSIVGPGTVRYDPRTRSYEVTGGGANMWGSADHFRYLWLKASGDIALEASVRFTDSQPDSGEAQPHRKAILAVRQSLDSSAVYADAALHADGLTSLQWRDATAAATHEVQSAVSAPTRLRIEKRGDYVSMYVAEGTEPLRASGGAAKIALGASFYIGLGVTAHDTTRIETATFSDVRIERLAPATDTGAVISTIETISLQSKDRRVAAVESQLTPARGVWWFPDSSKTLYYRSMWERLMRVQADVPGSSAVPRRVSRPHPVSSGISACDHCTTADTGRRWWLRDDASGPPSLILRLTEGTSAAFSQGSGDVELGIVSRWSPNGSTFVFASLKDYQIYVVRANSRQPNKITTLGRNADPVFSPDGQSIYFCSERSGRWQLWRMNVDGSQPEQLTRDGFDNTHPYPSPDGRSVALLSFEPAATARGSLRDARLRLLSLVDGKVDDLAKLLGGDSSLAAYPWSPDGQYLAFVSYQRGSR